MNEHTTPEPTEAWQRISAETTPYFYDQRAAWSLLRSSRWQDRLICPRCGSTDVREVHTSRVLEALSCRECRYNFTTIADSYFHGSRLPVFEHFQFITALALEPEASASRLARFFHWKTTTVSRQLSKVKSLPAVDFVRRLDGYQTFDAFSSVDEYLQQPSISLLETAFKERILQLLTPQGRKLRRSHKSTGPERVHPAVEIPEKPPTAPKRIALSLPEALRYLWDDDVAYELVDSLRWENKRRACPRCQSLFVLPVKRKMYRELYRCLDCQYMFNSLAGTIFQGTKMPLPRFFQFFVLQNALGESIKTQDICYALECTARTATIWLERGHDIESPWQFAFVDKSAAERLRLNGQKTAAPRSSFLSFCEMQGIVVNEPFFLEYAKSICRTSSKPSAPTED